MYTYIGWLLVWLVGCVWLVGWLVGCGWLVRADWLKIWRFSRKCSVKHFSHQKCQKIKKSPLGDIFSPKNTKNVVFHTFGSKLDLWLNPLAYGSVRKCTEPGVRKCTEGYGRVRNLYGTPALGSPWSTEVYGTYFEAIFGEVSAFSRSCERMHVLL